MTYFFIIRYIQTVYLCVTHFIGMETWHFTFTAEVKSTSCSVTTLFIYAIGAFPVGIAMQSHWYTVGIGAFVHSTTFSLATVHKVTAICTTFNISTLSYIENTCIRSQVTRVFFMRVAWDKINIIAQLLCMVLPK